MNGKLNIIAIMLLTLAIMLLFPILGQAQQKVYEISIRDEIEMGLHEYIKRGIIEAEEARADYIVLNMHTPGGAINAAVDIGKLLDETKIPVVAFVNTNAISAGAYIALHADAIYMMPTATMGSAAPINSSGNTAGDKAESYWLAEMTAAAENSGEGRDPKYAQAMVDPDVDVAKFGAPKGKLLTLTASDALEVGYSEGTVKSLAELYEMLDLQDVENVKVELTFSEKLARIITNPIVVPILLSIASLGLVMELYSPGFGIPGTMGLSALGLFFFGHMIAGFAGYESLILLIMGIILILAEFFLPGGITGIIGGVLVVISLLLAGANVVHMAYSILIAIILAVVGMVIIMKFFGKKLHVFNKLVLSDATTTEDGYVSNKNRHELLGKAGVTLTQMRPAGVVDIDGERIDAVSQGSFIEQGKQVKIIKVEGSRIVVSETLERVEE